MNHHIDPFAVYIHKVTKASVAMVAERCFHQETENYIYTSRHWLDHRTKPILTLSNLKAKLSLRAMLQQVA